MLTDCFLFSQEAKKFSSSRFKDYENMREASLTHLPFHSVETQVSLVRVTTTLTNQLYTVHCVGISPQAQHAQSMKLIWRPLDLILVLCLLAAMAFTILRGLVSVHHIHVTDRV